jgi:hypothetical protein
MGCLWLRRQQADKLGAQVAALDTVRAIRCPVAEQAPARSLPRVFLAACSTQLSPLRAAATWAGLVRGAAAAAS